ncbi:MAG: hypothetical protein H6976_09470 [Gammaproteobacteria bacterium]|nr:hypothetical protein [Gammaproteobacteria bacterium]
MILGRRHVRNRLELALIGVMAMIVVGRAPAQAGARCMARQQSPARVADIKGGSGSGTLHLEIKQSLREQGRLTEINDTKKDLAHQIKSNSGEDIQAEFDDWPASRLAARRGFQRHPAAGNHRR